MDDHLFYYTRLKSSNLSLVLNPMVEGTMFAKVVTVDTIWLENSFFAHPDVIISVPSRESPLVGDDNL